MDQNSMPRYVYVVSQNQKATEALCFAFLIGGITTVLISFRASQHDGSESMSFNLFIYSEWEVME